MAFIASFTSQTFQFKFAAGTSRGILNEKTSWFIIIENSNSKGIGEAGPLKGLSLDDIPHFGDQLKYYCDLFNKENMADHGLALAWIQHFIPGVLPSIKFAFETALLDLKNGGKRIIFDNEFLNESKPIPINGLIWMGEKDFMIRQIREKIENNFTCLKMKIGALDFETECDVLQLIRREFSERDLILRVDANGAFSPDNAMEKLRHLEEFNLHSIEQPIKAGQLERMSTICTESPVPIALDEELIGVTGRDARKKLLEMLQPSYIIVKPTLLGGFSDCTDWIDVASQGEVGWWITSALESNIGLNAICQYTAGVKAEGHQGLGTGLLYHNNIESPLEIRNGSIFYNTQKEWQIIF